jgi:FkbM family methyltransferase
MRFDPKRLTGILRSYDRLPELMRCRRHTPQWRRLFAGYCGLNTSLPFEIKIPSGRFEFVEASDIATFWQIFYRNMYPVLPSDKLVIDAGANIGAFSLYALASAPCRVIAIEPAPDSCARINSLLRSHQLSARCELHQAALGDHAGQTTIQLGPGSQFRRTGLDGQHAVKMVTLDLLIPPGEQVDLLKLDIEGAEGPVLTSLTPRSLSQIQRIVMEFHPETDATQAIERLKSHDFRLTKYQDDGGGYGMAAFVRK